jgi:hypothetical protein
VDIQQGPEVSIYTLLGFGVVVAHSNESKEKINRWRGTTGRRTFVSAPEWFNRYIWNVGGIKVTNDNE